MYYLRLKMVISWPRIHKVIHLKNFRLGKKVLWELSFSTWYDLYPYDPSFLVKIRLFRLFFCAALPFTPSNHRKIEFLGFQIEFLNFWNEFLVFLNEISWFLSSFWKFFRFLRHFHTKIKEFLVKNRVFSDFNIEFLQKNRVLWLSAKSSFCQIAQKKSLQF